MLQKKTCSKMMTTVCTAICLLGGAETPSLFVRHPKTVAVGPKPSAIVTEDLNGDGLPEIITADIGDLADPREERPANNELSLLVADKELSYVKRPPLRSGFAPYCIAVANIDALKAPDIVVGSFHTVQNRNLTLFRNLGETFEPVHFAVPAETLTYHRMRDSDNRPVFTTPGITSLIVRDINHDGFRDAVATGWSSDVLIVFPGTADTYFGPPRFTAAPGGPRDVAAADLDRDGQTDLVTTMYASGEVVLWKGDGAGSFQEAGRFKSRGELPHKIRIADINRDGKTDLVVSHCYPTNSVVVFYGEGGFAFGVSQEIVVGASQPMLQQEIRDLVVEDLNGDEKPDMALACYDSARVVVLVNRSQTTGFLQKFEQEAYTFREGRPRALCIADFNRDGARDIGVALWDTNAVALLLGCPSKKLLQEPLRDKRLQ